MYEYLNAPLTIRGVTLKNRLVFAPTTMGMTGEAYLAKMEAIAAGGAALVVVGDVPVEPAHGMSLGETPGFGQYEALVARIHRGGALAAAQLHMSDSDVAGLMKYMPDIRAGKLSPMELRPILNGLVSDYITGFSTERVAEIARHFGDAAVLAGKAGFDMIQIHGDRMCGSMSSSLYNKRTDRYGGSSGNRARFAAEVVTAVRAAMPDMPIDYKLAVRQEAPHYGNAGILEEELPVFLAALDAAGADSYHVALANHAELSDTIPPANHPYFQGEGCFLKFCDEVRSGTDKPLCGVGRLVHPAFVEEQLASGRIQLAAMSRQLLADPDWLNKVNAGREREIHYCIGCNQKCLGGMQGHQGTGCIFDSAQ